MTIVEMRILKQISGNTCKDKLQNDEICLRYKCLLLMKIWGRIVWDSLVICKKQLMNWWGKVIWFKSREQRKVDEDLK